MKWHQPIQLFLICALAATAGAQGGDAEAVRREGLATELNAAQRDLMQWDQRLADLNRTTPPDDPRRIEAQRQRDRAQQRVLQADGGLTNMDRRINPGVAEQIQGAQREMASWDRKLAELNSRPGDQTATRAEYMRQRQQAGERLARLQGRFYQDQNQRVENPADLGNRQSLLTQIAGAQREVQSWDRRILELQRQGITAGTGNPDTLDRRTELLQRNLTQYQQQLANIQRGNVRADAAERERLQRNITQAERDLRSLEKRSAGQSAYRQQNQTDRYDELMRNRNRAQQRLNYLEQKLRELDSRR